MAIYHNFTSNSTGHVKGKYCNQYKNESLHDCSASDPKFMPLSRNAQQSWNYAQNQTLFYWDMIHAFIKLTNIPTEHDTKEFTNITAAWVCVCEVDPYFGISYHFLECQGDVFMQGCAGFKKPSCP